MCLSNLFLHKFKISSILCLLVLEYESFHIRPRQLMSVLRSSVSKYYIYTFMIFLSDMFSFLVLILYNLFYSPQFTLI